MGEELLDAGAVLGGEFFEAQEMFGGGEVEDFEVFEVMAGEDGVDFFRWNESNT